MLALENRLTPFAFTGLAITFVLVVVDLGRTPLLFENLRAEVGFSVPFLLWLLCRWLRVRV